MLGDTIAAVSSPPGAGARGIVRVSGPDAREAGSALVGDLPAARAALERTVRILGHDVECLVLVMPGPRSYTGEDVVELHLPGSPLLLEMVLARLRELGVRDATPGEFTRRAWENGRLDLVAVEGVLALVHAADDEERRRALAVLSGDLSSAVQHARDALVDARAWVEAGLDFTEDETGAVDSDRWRPRLDEARERLRALVDQVPVTAPGGELLLLGAANAGKSSLCNALSGRDVVLVGEQAGTTRDVVAVPLPSGTVLLDAPGDLTGTRTAIDAGALALRDRLSARAAGAVLVVDATDPRWVPSVLPVVAVVTTKIDRAAAPTLPALPLPHDVPRFAVSNVTGEGLDVLRTWLARRAPAARVACGDRLGDRLRTALVAVDRACGSTDALPELVASDLADALASLDAVSGRSTPEDVLDRIFAGFCLGK